MPVVYVTGIPRSGSTWGYNVCRLILTELHGDIPNYNDNQTDEITSSTKNAIVKTHKIIGYRPPGSIVVHSTRDYQHAIQSWRRLDPFVTAEPSYLESLDRKWRPHADFIYHHCMLHDRASRDCIVLSLSRLLKLRDYNKSIQISRQVDRLEIPTEDINPITYLQPRHRG